MKTKYIYFFLATLILASFACQTETPAEKSLPTREAVIQTAAPFYATPQNWDTVPKGCVDSLIQIGSGENEDGKLASGTLIYSSYGTNQSGETGYIYSFSTANHFATSSKIKMSSRVSVRTNKIGELSQAVNFTTINIENILDDKNTPIDAVLITVFGPNPALTIQGNGPIPIGTENFISGTDLTVDKTKFYHALGYPKGVSGPQFVIATVIGATDYDIYHNYKTITIESLSDTFSTTTKGTSGGPLCNNDGKIVAINIEANDQYNQAVFVPLPQNISQQISDFINKSESTLQMLGFTNTP